MKTVTGKRQLIRSFFVAAICALAGCGGGAGGSGAPAAPTLSGVAAVGFPIVNGSISARCATGAPLTATTNSTGGWQVTLAATHTLPCAVQVSGGTINNAANTTPYHSIATTTGNVNVTPLTDLMVANLTGNATPSAWFTGLSTTPAPLTTITQANVDASLTKLRAALSTLAPLGTTNPITTAFIPAPGNISDDMLSALKAAMTSMGTAYTYTSMLGSASVPAFTVPSGFSTALATAYAGTTSGSTSTGSTTTASIANFAGSYNLTTGGGTTATITFDSAGNVSSCKLSTVVACSGKLTLNATTGVATIQVSGNDGLSPVDTSASISGTIAASGSVTGSFSGSSVTTGPFSGTFTGSKPGCATPPAAPTGVAVTHVAGTSFIDNYITWNPVANASYYEVLYGHLPTATDVVFGVPPCAYLPGCTDTWAGSYPFSINHEYYAVKAVNSCGVRSALSAIVPSPLVVAMPVISSISPTSGAVGTVVNIAGTNFNATPANNTVKFNGTAATVTSASATSITVTVPSGATTGTISVATAGGTATSTGSFTVSTGVAALPATSMLTVAGSINASLAMSKDAYLADTNGPYIGTQNNFLMYNGLYSGANSFLPVNIYSRNWSGADGVTSNLYKLNFSVIEDAAHNLILYVDGTTMGGTLETYNVGTNLTAWGDCAIGGTIVPTCASAGITLNRSAGTITFLNTPMVRIGVSPYALLGAFTLSGTLSFTPF